MVGMDRAILIATLKGFVDWLSLLALSDPVWRERIRTSSDPHLDELLRQACEAHGLTYEQYTEAIASDLSLAELHRSALQAIVGQVDPGPYDVLSGRDRPESGVRPPGESK